MRTTRVRTRLSTAVVTLGVAAVALVAGCAPSVPVPDVPDPTTSVEPEPKPSPTASRGSPTLPDEWDDGEVVVLTTADAVPLEDVAAREVLLTVDGAWSEDRYVVAVAGTLSPDGDVVVRDIGHDAETLELAPEYLSLRSADGTDRPIPMPDDGASGMRHAVMAASLDGSGRRALDLWSATHAASGDALLVAVDARHDPDAAAGRYEIVRLSPLSDDPPRRVVGGAMPDGSSVTAVAADGDALAWVVGAPRDRGGRAVLYAQDGDRRVAVEIPDPLGSAPLSISDGRVAWGDGSGDGGAEYLLDLRDGSLARLGTSVGYSTAVVAGDMVAWTQVNPDGRSSSVHVARLPR